MEHLSGFALAESLSVAASRAVEAVHAASDVVSSTASGTMETSREGCELQQHIARRSHRFVEGFARTCVEATGRNVSDAGESLRMTTLNCAIRSEASATSDVPALARAAKAMRCGGCGRDARTRTRTNARVVKAWIALCGEGSSAKAALEEYERRSSALPSLRYELLEDLSEKKLALEKKIEAVSAPREQKRKQVLKDLMSKPARGEVSTTRNV